MTTIRAGIMSMQRIRNYGSTLQAYGLKRSIEALGGTEVSFLDYEPGEVLVGDGDASTGLRRTIEKIMEYRDVDAGFADRLRFLNHKRAYPSYLSILDLERSATELDVQVVGSDEVFNCFQTNTRVGYARDLFGHPPHAPRLISYAASFGNATSARIKDAGLQDQIADDLGRFDALSVRDDNSARIVTELCGIEPQIHADPVIVHDWANLEPQIPEHRLNDEPYVIAYGYSGRFREDENREVERVASEMGAQVISIGGVQGCADRFVDCSPFELLAWFRDAEAVVTDTFHGTIFSLISMTPFASLVRTSTGTEYGNEEKLTYLLDMFSAGSHRLGSTAELADVLARPVDTEAVRATVTRERERALAYLRTEILTEGEAAAK